ncbi:uncharacterized protein BJ171DRAFT_557457 [Polychytrium aggregatum]|uniref:uncharacterized protein n=1 Tax=Polychytrium aggregatum TaxID=110093 RepID=UPI0022FEC535|nr:uncharacterized protein BJ171DRAFT_557457 [Polychytrium aggregatum]KAI9209653.1 hypothetical protein BJ171DRAFT_557457 [Polychytrium aggregatum]
MSTSSLIATDPEGYEFPRSKLRTLQDPSKIPLVVVACGSYSPVTYLHLRMFEIAYDALRDQGVYEVLGGYFSPVSDMYSKPGLAPASHRIEMCQRAVETSSWIMVDTWEPKQSSYQRTATVLDHFHEQLNGPDSPSGGRGILLPDGSRTEIRVMLLAGGDLIQSFAVPNLWATADLNHILGKYGCVIIERTGADVHDFLLSNDSLHQHRKKVIVCKQYIHNDINSTKIRLFIRRGMSIKYLLPDRVVDYIHEHKLYLPDSK